MWNHSWFYNECNEPLSASGMQLSVLRNVNGLRLWLIKGRLVIYIYWGVPCQFLLLGLLASLSSKSPYSRHIACFAQWPHHSAAHIAALVAIPAVLGMAVGETVLRYGEGVGVAGWVQSLARLRCPKWCSVGETTARGTLSPVTWIPGSHMSSALANRRAPGHT